MLRKMEKSGVQDNIITVAKSNLYQRERRVSGTIGSIDKGRIESGNNQSDQLVGSLTVEQDICIQEIRRKIEENNGLLATEHAIESQTFYNEQSEQVTEELEKYMAFAHRGIHYTQVGMPF
ncbi:MAG: hypothetical protein EZS28_040560 [Streblomastix strix]|uniref:Uncharacterized protein n=1 Tax=Streblomastix strix TaxID=222440 RepID=A0A5J4U0Z7_9EUKA|nr:MAG: hypothetical protein EZS28_040560 [Streblomastix strix]